MNLSSRAVEADTIADLRDIIENSEVEVHIVEDFTVDPPIRKIKLADSQVSELLSLTHTTDQFSLYDVIRLLDKLGFVTDYVEVR